MGGTSSRGKIKSVQNLTGKEKSIYVYGVLG